MAPLSEAFNGVFLFMEHKQMSLKIVTAKLNHTECENNLCLREYCIVTGLLGLATPTDEWGV